ncbi:hypothetical protein X975_25411, partial [Stegodyphus mimosarum]
MLTYPIECFVTREITHKRKPHFISETLWCTSALCVRDTCFHKYCDPALQ